MPSDQHGARAYHHTDDRTGEVILECDECGQLSAESRIEDGLCPDCQGEGRS